MNLYWYLAFYLWNLSHIFLIICRNFTLSAIRPNKIDPSVNSRHNFLIYSLASVTFSRWLMRITSNSYYSYRILLARFLASMSFSSRLLNWPYRSFSCSLTSFTLVVINFSITGTSSSSKTSLIFDPGSAGSLDPKSKLALTEICRQSTSLQKTK